MKKVLKLTATFLSGIFLIFIFRWNINLYYQPDWIQIHDKTVNQEVLYQMNFLKDEIHHGAAEEMQEVFPEGFIFFNAIYGLAWCELIKNLNQNTSLAKEATNEINWAIQKVNSTEGKETFSKSLSPAYGAFYQGWTSVLLGQKLLLSNAAQRDSSDIKKFLFKCEIIALAYEQNNYGYLPSYANAIWPADNVICLAALAIHDKLFTPKYQETLNKCLLYIKANLDSSTGLIPHAVGTKEVRGSSQSLINVFMPEIDSVLAKQIFKRYKENFLDHRLGLAAILEYKKGQSGGGDIDSGPVIWGVGGVASIVGIKAMAANKEFSVAKSLRNNIEGLGVPLNLNGQKRYFLGVLPMIDAFVAWANVTEVEENKASHEANNRLLFHSIGGVIFLLNCYCVYIIWKKN